MAAIKKERIKDQMIKTAARLWNIPDNEIETNFDPLILLLIEACAAELEKISFDINASHARLLERLADLIVPEAVMGPKPASCIATATPSETTATLNSLTRFSAVQRIQNVNAASYNLSLFFTPVGDFLLHKAKLSFTLIGKKLFQVHANSPKELVHNGDVSNTGKVNELWLAITPDKSLKTLKGLSLYFDLRGHSKANTFYNSIGNAKAWIGNREIKLVKGYFRHEQFELNPEEMLVAGHNYSQKINRQVAGIYQNHFLHIADNIEIAPGQIPDFLQQSLPKQTLQKLSAEPIIFLKIQLSRYFTQEDLDGLTCSINAFPLINRKYNSQNYRTDAWLNIIPIQVEGSFLDLHSITNVKGSNYKFRLSADAQKLSEGEAMVRSSGIGKTSSREVREIISSLMDSIRDESAYFSELNNDFILARLKEISQILARLEDQLQKSIDMRAEHYYILLKPKNVGEIVTINYWTTNGALAHQLKAGTFLTPHNHTLTGAKETYTISNAAGGKTTFTEPEKKLLLKQQLTSNGKLISAEDIRMLCAQLFGDKLRRVTISKGVQTGDGATQGFNRTIDVLLTVNDKENPEIDYLKKELTYILENKATLVYPFRVIVE